MKLTDIIHSETLLSHQETGIDTDTCFCSSIFGLQDTLSLSLDYRVVGQPSKDPLPPSPPECLWCEWDGDLMKFQAYLLPLPTYPCPQVLPSGCFPLTPVHSRLLPSLGSQNGTSPILGHRIKVQSLSLTLMCCVV